jgi:hypothetical protein
MAVGERRILIFLKRLDTAQKVGLLAAVSVLVVAQMTLGLTLTSKSHFEAEAQALHADALLGAIASRTAGLIASGDMLTAASELNRLQASPIISGAAIADVEGETLIAAGSFSENGNVYRRPLAIGPDIAGTLSVNVLSTTSASSITLSVTALSLVLAIISYAACASVLRSQGTRIANMLKQVGRANTADLQLDPLTELEAALDALPLALKTDLDNTALDETSLRSMAVTTLSLDHLRRYIDTVDEITLVNYVGTYEAIVKAVAQLLGGELHPSRPQSLSLFFEGTHRGMTPDLRAVIAGSLLQHLLTVAERSQRRKFACGIGIGCSDLSRGERHSAYAMLYTQAVIDETLNLAQRAGSSVKLASSIQESTDISRTFDIIDTADGDTQLGAPTAELLPELDRQSKFLQRRLFPDVGEQSDLPF